MRNCTLRPYLSSTYAIITNTTNTTSTTAHPNQSYKIQQQLNGPKELSYINADYVRARNAFVSTTSEKPTKTKNGTMAKFNKKSLPNGSVSGVALPISTLRELRTKARRNTKSYNPKYHKNSHSTLREDERLDALVSDDIDVEYTEMEDDENDQHDRNDKIPAPTFSTAKSNLSYMTSRIDHQRKTRQQNFYPDAAKRNLKSWTKGSNSHKTNGDDSLNEMSFESISDPDDVADAIDMKTTNSMQDNRGDTVDPATLPDPLSSSSRTTSTIKSTVSGDNISSGNDRNHTRDELYVRKNKNQNHFDNHKNYNNLKMKSSSGPHKPNVAYLKSATTSEPKSMHSAINNHHLNSNNVIVDSYESPPTTMELECVAGYDGGLPQHFVLEAYDSRTKKLRLNITSAFSDIPLFRIDLSGMVFSTFHRCSL